MNFQYLLLFGVLCTTIGSLYGDDSVEDRKELKVKEKKLTLLNEKKSLTKKAGDKQSTQDSTVSASLSVAVTPAPAEVLTDIGTPEYENFPDENTEPSVPSTHTAKDFKNESATSDQRYFTTKFIPEPAGKAYWVDLTTLPKHQVFKHDVLSESHRRAASITLPFKFPFYGNNLTKATIATGGFLYMGEHIHSWLAATQYIAPLMAHFDTRNSSESNILYGYNSSMFVITWEKVNLLEKTGAEFTFQCILHRNGDISFVYKDIPIPIQDISDAGHPLKIGVSDAYFIQREQVYLRRKTIYEYHKVDMINETISNNTAILLTAKPTCISFKTCSDCVTSTSGFECHWCPSQGRCSDGYDRNRQEWIQANCDKQPYFFSNLSQCTAPIFVPSVEPVPIDTNHSSFVPNNSTSDHDKHYDIHDGKNSSTDVPFSGQESNQSPDSASKRTSPKTPASGGHWAASFMGLLTLVGAACLWVMYAYRNPTTPSGQLLIRWRPSHWRSMYSETRYQAASIHM